MPSYRCGDIYVDMAGMRVLRNGTPLDLEPKAFDVLRVLVERRDRLVTKEELLDAVWGETFVTPNVLTRVVAQLRKALGDDAQEARYIQTVMKRGYRFIAEVSVEGGPGALAEPTPAVASEPGPEVAGDWTPKADEARRSSRGRFRMAVVAAAVLLVTVTVAAAVLFWRKTAPAPPAATTAAVRQGTRVTLAMGANSHPTLSPDGATVAYASDRSGRVEIYAVSLVRGSREIALTSDGQQNVQPAWSPDGRWIAYHSRTRHGIWLVPSTGGAPTQIASEGSEPAWAPDSESLVFCSSEGATSTASVLRVVSRDGSGMRDLTAPGRPQGGHTTPTWSQNGRHIAFAVSDGRFRTSGWIVAATGGEPRRIFEGLFSHPAFGPDDRALYYRGSDPAYDVILRMPINPEDATPSGASVEVARSPSYFGDGLSTSRTGVIAYDQSDTGGQLWAVDLNASGQPGTPVPLVRGPVRLTAPAYSPSGRLAFTQGGNGVELSVWIQQPDGSAREPVFTEGVSTAPSWSTGERLLLQRGLEAGGELLLVDPLTKRFDRVAQPAGIRVNNPRLSPDGREVAYWQVESSGAMNTWILPVAGGPAARVTVEGQAAHYPAWSPDGQWLAVEVQRGERTQIGVVSKRGGTIEMLTDAPEQNWPHSWSPDGEFIAFAGLRNSVWNIYTVSRRTREIRQLTRFDASTGYVRYPAWSPDGRRIAFERRISEGSIWTISEP